MKEQNELGKKMLANKSALKVKSESGMKLSKLLENIDELLKNSMEHIKNILQEQHSLKSENDCLQNEIAKMKVMAATERERILNLGEQVKEKMGPSMVE